MKELIQVLKENKWILVVMALLATVFIAWSIWQVAALNIQDDGQNGTAYEEEYEGQDSSQEATIAISDLSPRLQELHDRYTEEIMDLQVFLQSNWWIDKDSDTVLSFNDFSYSLQLGGSSSLIPFAISARSATSPTDGMGAGAESFIAVIETEDTTGVMLLSYLPSIDEYGGSEWTLFSPVFGENTIFERMSPNLDFEIVGFESGLDLFSAETTELVFVPAEELTSEETTMLPEGEGAMVVQQIDPMTYIYSAFEERVSLYHPTATLAEWSGFVEINFVDGTRSTSFFLNDRRSTIVELVYHIEESRLEVR